VIRPPAFRQLVDPDQVPATLGDDARLILI